ncbi:FAD-binding domain-containing protein [Atractiella rhizophila]|nr:FAD-binding domain-containing protein [Atractiella rhizophila]
MGIVFLPLLALLSFSSFSQAKTYCTDPSSSCWPSSSAWDSFNSTLSGALLRTLPYAAPCHTNTGYSISGCWERTTKNSDMDYKLTRQLPQGYFNSYWETGNSSCYLASLPTTKCEQGLTPYYSVNASSVPQVQEAVKFAAANDLRLRIKCSGHDLLGRMSGEGALSIWTHYIQGMEWIDSFTPANAPSGTGGLSAVRIGAGVVIEDIYEAAAAKGLQVVAGMAHTVCAAGGFLQGGGHSILGPKYGLAIDNVLEMQVVAASGDVVVANAYTNQDLFWRIIVGGGGSTFGVVTSVVYQTHPAATVLSGEITFIPTKGILSYLYKAFASLANQGFAPAIRVTLSLYSTVKVLKVDPSDGDYDNLLSALNLTNFPGIANFTLGIKTQSFIDYYRDNPGTSAGMAGIIGSRLVPNSAFSGEPDSLADYTLSLTASSINLVASGAVQEVAADATSIHPSWRANEPLWHFVVANTGWVPGLASQSTIDSSVNSVRSQVQELDQKFSKGTGSYINEADPFDPQYPNIFWGDNYPRLLKLKGTLDPDGVFGCQMCVGRENGY